MNSVGIAELLVVSGAMLASSEWLTEIADYLRCM